MKTDDNDFIDELLQRAAQPELTDAEAREKLKARARPLRHYDKFGEALRMDWAVKNFLARGHSSNLVGPPGSGKSGAVSSLSVHLGTARSWHGLKIRRPLATVHFAFERASLVEKRIWAECERDGIDKVPVAVCPGIINLLDPKCVDEIVGTILRAEDDFNLEAGLSTFDTFGKGISAGGGDENHAKDKGRAWENLRRVHEMMARYHPVHLMGISHTGKDESKGDRGSNAGVGDNDVEAQVYTSGPIKTLEINKANELPTGALLQYKMEPYDTGLKDDDGESVEVWIVSNEFIGIEPQDHRPGKAKIKLSKSDRVIRAAFSEVMDSRGQQITPGVGMPQVRAVRQSDLKDEFTRRYAATETDASKMRDAKRKAFDRAFERLPGITSMEIAGVDWIWHTKKETRHG